MILPLLLVLQTAPAPQDELNIEVVGRRLAAISATVSQGAGGKLGCALSASSGYARLDEQLCRAATQCVRKGARDSAAVKACIDKRKPALLADFKRGWRASQ
ncbi:hypothetical protein OMP43_09990 [Sphingomonas sp. CBMAI 2297]|uniref:hypothetical protein n=1 Tax=Sphingomonas sp. CBMAI 2297 TaxID=2991720 RepID=UPI0024559352|nr:hypothetical protein [Sphingomonas sp. CBMAI 2297]MDH4744344.1 hypothetical protein [Sphingomonas sp. CBMAI 2297]